MVMKQRVTVPYTVTFSCGHTRQDETTHHPWMSEASVQDVITFMQQLRGAARCRMCARHDWWAFVAEQDGWFAPTAAQAQEAAA